MLRRLLSNLLQRKTGGAAHRQGADEARVRGDWAQAARQYQINLDNDAADAPSHNNFGIVLCELGRLDEADAQFNLALSIDSTLVAARLNLGHLCLQRQQYRAAVGHYEAVLNAAPDQVEARRQMCLAYYELGEVSAALECVRPGNDGEFDLLGAEYSLFMANAVPGRDLAGHFRDHLRWGAKLETAAAMIPAPARGSNPPEGSKIRVGYVSADFREHAIARFLLPVLEGHDRTLFEVFCYANQRESDELTRTVQSLPLQWRDIWSLDDHRAASMIAADGIDILIDVSGHTRSNRLGVFALRPAKIQMTWLGYLNTTGMQSIDYRITDSLMDPIGLSEKYHAEKLLRIDPAGWCYRPPPDAPHPTTARFETNGVVTFGSFNHVAKLNDRVLECWSEILARCPDSRLKIAGVPDQQVAQRLARPFLRRGIDADRIQCLPRMPRNSFFAEMARVDIALDPFPYCGGATTCECLWMGLPVVALAGDFGFGRSSSAIISQAGLHGLTASTQEEYIDLALSIAKEGGAGFRNSVRDRMRDSDLMNEKAFVRRLEAVYIRSRNGI